jgi:hypothetical protein
MKTKIEFQKSEWVFKIADTLVTLRWDYKGKTQVGWQNCKQYEVSCIIYNDGSGLLNKICAIKYTTSLQPNYGNSLNYLKRILKINQ